MREVEAIARRTAERRNVLVAPGDDGPTRYLLAVGSRVGAGALGLDPAALPEIEVSDAEPELAGVARAPGRRPDLRWGQTPHRTTIHIRHGLVTPSPPSGGMMDFSLSPELIELRARVRALVDDVLHRSRTRPSETTAGSRPRRTPASTQAVLDSGLAANNIPTEFGGGGFNLTEQIVTHEQLGRLTNCLWVLVWTPSNVLVHGTPEQIERYLLPDVRGEHRHAYAITEGDAGSDPRAIDAEAVWNGDHYELSGTKWFVTDGDVASYFIVLAWAVDGHERLPALFLVDKDLPGVEMTADPDFTHNFPYRHPEFTFTKTPVPRENILGELGRGFELTGEWFVEERVHIAARCVGACDRLIELGTDWALQREQFGGRIFDHQAVSFALADCAAEVTAARLLTYYVGWLADSGADRKLVHHKASMAKLVASETAGRVADRVVQIFGGRGYMRENPAERLWRELRVDRIWEGTSRDPAADHRPRPRAARAGDAALALVERAYAASRSSVPVSSSSSSRSYPSSAWMRSSARSRSRGGPTGAKMGLTEPSVTRRRTSTMPLACTSVLGSRSRAVSSRTFGAISRSAGR